MSTTTPPVVDGGPPEGNTTDGRAEREGAIRAGVLAALGRPAQLYRIAVVPLWGDHYRVNVITGEDPTSLRIPHSYFLAADGRGNIIESTPRITRQY
ncbi:MAG: hypothetical protein JWO38_4683 [Gemmataceae bacterium]|nr:hypothetical protein [Gemmataceae bacterium]